MGRIVRGDKVSSGRFAASVRWLAVDALLTNFHLPRSTLLAMVMSFGGQELVREAYSTAVRERYRFYSFGDAMLLLDGGRRR